MWPLYVHVGKCGRKVGIMLCVRTPYSSLSCPRRMNRASVSEMMLLSVEWPLISLSVSWTNTRNLSFSTGTGGGLVELLFVGPFSVSAAMSPSSKPPVVGRVG